MTKETTTTNNLQQEIDNDKTIEFRLHDFKELNESFDYSDDPLSELLNEFKTSDDDSVNLPPIPNSTSNSSNSKKNSPMQEFKITRGYFDEDLLEDGSSKDVFVLLEDQVKLLRDSINRISYYIEDIDLMSS